MSYSRMMCVMAWATWFVAVGPAFPAIILDMEMISEVKPISPPEDRIFLNGYEVLTEPTADAKPIKIMPAGEAKVAAYLEVEGRRYYMTDWSYDRLKAGLSYNWIRPLGAGQSSRVVGSGGGGGSGSGYRITGLPAGETLNIRSGPGTNFTITGELPNGKNGIQITGDGVMNGEAEWVPISYPGGKGWARTKYLARVADGGVATAAAGAEAPSAPVPATLAPERTPSSVSGGPQGPYSGDIRGSNLLGEPSFLRTVSFRPGELPAMVSNGMSSRVNRQTFYVALNGSWTGKEFVSTTQREPSTQLPVKGWVDEKIVITILSDSMIKMESILSLDGERVPISGVLARPINWAPSEP